MTETTQTIRSEGGNGAAETARDKAKEVASQGKDKAREAAGEARGRVQDQVDQRSTQVGEQVSAGVSDARSVAEQLRNQGKETPARYVEQAADRAERFGGYLRDSDGDRLLSDVEDFARRNTWAVALGGVALGFAASRLLKASSSERYRSTQLPAQVAAPYGGPAPAPAPATPATPAASGLAGTTGDGPSAGASRSGFRE